MNFCLYRSIAALGLVLLSLLSAAGCGSSSDAADTAASTDTLAASALTKAQFIAKADAICERGEKKYPAEVEAFVRENNLPPKIKTLPPDKRDAEVQDVLVPTLQSQADEIAQLGIPNGEDEQVAPIVEGFQDALKEVAKDPALLPSPLGPLVKVARSARKYGFKVCLKSF